MCHDPISVAGAFGATLTDASVSRGHEFVVGRTLTLETSLIVNASAVQARLRTFTLVYVRAIASRVVYLVAFVALAAKHPKYIFALPIQTEVAEHLAFIYV